jgi:hypothetical protein
MNDRYLRDTNLLPMQYELRSLVVVLALCLLHALHAQVLFVDDNDNILENSTTMLAALQAAGVDPVIHNVATTGGNPTLSEMLDYELVIWYCSGDGVDLGLWDAPADLQDLALAGVPIWFIGTDMLYANYPSVPTTFTTADLPFTVMGVASYDVQSYGSDGGEGCPQIDTVPALADAFSSAVQWVFTTLWWVDGVTPAPGNVEVIYQMGPEGYALAGSPCMLRKRRGHGRDQYLLRSRIDRYAGTPHTFRSGDLGLPRLEHRCGRGAAERCCPSTDRRSGCPMDPVRYAGGRYPGMGDQWPTAANDTSRWSPPCAGRPHGYRGRILFARRAHSARAAPGAFDRPLRDRACSARDGGSPHGQDRIDSGKVVSRE